MAMKRDEIMKILRAHKVIPAVCFDVAELALFGSFARDEAGEVSDLDVLVRFDGRSKSKGYFGAQFYIEYLLGRHVYLVTEKALREELRPYIEKEIIHI